MHSGVAERSQKVPSNPAGPPTVAARAAAATLSQPSLAGAPAGQDLCVLRLNDDTQHAGRLRELGMFEGQTVRVLTAGNPLICKVGDCRFGICQRLARCILVEPAVPPAARSA